MIERERERERERDLTQYGKWRMSDSQLRCYNRKKYVTLRVKAQDRSLWD